MIVIEAFGGSYEDAWTCVVAVCKTESRAAELIESLEEWLGEIRNTELPESVELHNFDESNDEEMIRRDIALGEFREQVLIDMGVPEELHEWLTENWDYSYDCDVPGYRTKEVPLL